MHPILLHLAHLGIPTEGFLVALGLLAALQSASALAPRLALSPDRIWNLGLTILLTSLLSQRLLVIAFNVRDFLAHPFWMLGLTTVRDARYTYAGALLALLAGVAYVVAWQLPWRRVADALAPAASIAMVFISLGAFAAGAHPGRPTAPAWGIVSVSRAATLLYGIPPGVSLLPLMLYTALLHLALAAIAWQVAVRARRPGSAAALWLAAAGMGTVLLDQWRYRTAGESLLFSAYTPAQAAGILALLVGCWMGLATPPATLVAQSAPHHSEGQDHGCPRR